MHPLVQKIEEIFLSDLQRRVSGWQAKFPDYKFNVWSSPTGSLTEYAGHDVGVECLIPQSSADSPSLVVFDIRLCHLNSVPRVAAEVALENSSAETSFPEDWKTNADWPEATPEVLDKLAEIYPVMLRVFERAVERGTPES